MCLYAGAWAVSGFFRGGGREELFRGKKNQQEGSSHVDIFVSGDISFESLGPSPVPVFLRVTVCHVLPKGSKKNGRVIS